MFRFQSPLFLLMLALIPAAIWYARRRMPRPALASSGTRAVEQMAASPAVRLAWLPQTLFYIVLILMIGALARPQYGTRQTTVTTSGINIILALDLSESMAALDFKHQGKIINRLEATKNVVREFIANRQGDRVGMVVFGSQAYTQLPLTRDYDTIDSMLQRLKIGSAGRATAVGNAIGISLKRIEDIESDANIIILLTDGRSNSGELEPLDAAAIAKEKGVKIYTIGMGGTGRAPFLINDAVFGQRYTYRRVDLDEKTLVAIADATDGLYFRAQEMEGLKKIYTTIDKMEKSEVSVKTFAEYDDLYIHLLLPAFILLGVWVVLKNTRFLSIP